jgi:hypothetical protein
VPSKVVSRALALYLVLSFDVGFVGEERLDDRGVSSARRYTESGIATLRSGCRRWGVREDDRGRSTMIGGTSAGVG